MRKIENLMMCPVDPEPPKPPKPPEGESIAKPKKGKKK